MHKKYLDILGLREGASKTELKKAYRQLSKQYHPDLNNNPEATHRFVAITEAYRFLLKVGTTNTASATSGQQQSTHQAYYQQQREYAKQYAKKRAREEAKLQQELMRSLLYQFKVLSVVIVGFNLILAIDYLLPQQTYLQHIEEYEVVTQETRSTRSQYNDFVFTDFEMRFKYFSFNYSATEKEVYVLATPILKTPMHAVFIINGSGIRHSQAYGIYQVFGFVIPAILVGFIFYTFVFRTLENKLTMALIMILAFLLQLFLFFSY